MNLTALVESLSVSEREELLNILTNSTSTWTTMPPNAIPKNEGKQETHKYNIKEDFTMHKINALQNNRRREPVKARENTWVDTGESKDIITPESSRTPRNRTPPKKKNVTCHICGKAEKVHANLIYGEYYRCDRCTGNK